MSSRSRSCTQNLYNCMYVLMLNVCSHKIKSCPHARHGLMHWYEEWDSLHQRSAECLGNLMYEEEVEEY